MLAFYCVYSSLWKTAYQGEKLSTLVRVAVQLFHPKIIDPSLLNTDPRNSHVNASVHEDQLYVFKREHVSVGLALGLESDQLSQAGCTCMFENHKKKRMKKIVYSHKCIQYMCRENPWSLQLPASCCSLHIHYRTICHIHTSCVSKQTYKRKTLFHKTENINSYGCAKNLSTNAFWNMLDVVAAPVWLSK